jgi:hypothetical protein
MKAILSTTIFFWAACMLSGAASGQCTNCVPGDRVNDLYQKDPYGHWLYQVNGDNSTIGMGGVTTGNWNFSLVTGGQRYVAGMGGPTILYLPETGHFYATGSSSMLGRANYLILKSPDLVNWTFHMTAFSEANRQHTSTDYTGPFYVGWPRDSNGALLPLPDNDPRLNNYINGIHLQRMDAPAMYRDNGRIWLSFQASDGPWQISCMNGTTQYMNEAFATAWVASIEITQFQNASNHFAGERTYEPQRYTYLKNGSPVQPPDGGKMISRPTPCAGNFALSANPCPGEPARQMVLAGHRWSFQLAASGTGVPQAATLIVGDPFVFFDDLAGNEQWMMYAWRAERVPDVGFNGNNVAAHPLETNRLFKASAPLSDFIPIAYRYTTQANEYIPLWISPSNIPVGWPKPAGSWMYNGFCDEDGAIYGTNFGGTPAEIGPIGVVEGPGAFNYNPPGTTGGPFTYVYYSRNRWVSGAYGIWYRKIARAAGSRFTAAALPGWSATEPSEKVLAAPQNMGMPGGPNGGNGELFLGPPDRNGVRRPYLVIGVKMTNSGAKNIYFKELYFESNGDIKPISNTNTKNAQDWSCFLVPYNGPACLGQIGDFNRDGFKTNDDFYAYMDAYNAGLPSADVDGVLGVTPNDLAVFTNDWNRPCW